MSKYITHTKLSETLDLTECKDGFWLYDDTRGMNLAMMAKTEREAFLEALEYYQERLTDLESAYKCLDGRVQTFVSQFINEDENE